MFDFDERKGFIMKRTKELLTDTFWELLEEKPYSKITVNDIVNRCDVNRNTFYYHFQDIPSLMIISIEKWADYIIKEYGISQMPVNCLSYMAQECTKRKRALLHLFHSVEKEKLLSNMNEIAYHIICTYANEMKERRNIPEKDKETLIQCYKCFFVGSFLEWLEKDASFDLGKFYEDAYGMLSYFRK